MSYFMLQDVLIDGEHIRGIQDGEIHELQHEIPLFCPFYCDHVCIKKSYEYDLLITSVVSGLCMTIALWNISKHLQYFTNPNFQAKIIIILCMAPFYALTSILSMFFYVSLNIFFFQVAALYLTVIRDCYEAFLLFTFFYLIEAYLAYDYDTGKVSEEKLYLTMISQTPDPHDMYKNVHHFWPVNYCTRPYRLSSIGKAKYFTYRCKKYILQCFILKPLLSVLALIAIPLSPHFPFMIQLLSWINIFVATSVTFSLYYLILFYTATKEPLAPYSPLLKFLIIKITLFFTFWQALMLNIFEEQLLECFDQKSSLYSDKKIIAGIENFLVVMEMFMMCLAGSKAFSFHDFQEERGKYVKGKFCDVIRDLQRTFLYDLRLLKPKKPGFTSESSIIEGVEMITRNSIRLEFETKILVDSDSESKNDLSRKLIVNHI